MTERRITIFLINMYAVGAIGHLIPATLTWMLAITPFILLGLGLVAFIPILKGSGVAFWLWCTGVYVITFLFEAIGVATGRIFGPYFYGATLGPKLCGVPIVIGFNWLLVILGSISLVSRWSKYPALSAILVGVLALLFDYVMEPIALRLDYWQWHTAGIPLHNYITWFSIAVIATGGYHALRLHLDSCLLHRYMLIQLAFFLVLRISIV